MPPMNRSIQIRLTVSAYEQIKANCKQRGFAQLSTFLRHLALAQDHELHQRVTEIHAHLIPPPPKTRRNFKPNPSALPQ